MTVTGWMPWSREVVGWEQDEDRQEKGMLFCLEGPMTPRALVSPFPNSGLARPQVLSLDWIHHGKLDSETLQDSSCSRERLWTKPEASQQGAVFPQRENPKVRDKKA